MYRRVGLLMISRALHVLKVENTWVKNLRLSHLPSNHVKTIRLSSQAAPISWVQDNQLFQRHPKLRQFELRFKRSYHHFKQLLSFVFVSGLHRNPFVMSRILYMCLIEFAESNGKESLEDFGVRVFNQIQNPNTFSWNTMIRFFGSSSDARNSEIAFHYYVTMLRQEIVPDKYTFPLLLQASGASSHERHLVKQVHNQVLKLPLGHDLFVQNSLLYAYLRSGAPVEARQLFAEMSDKDIVSWTSLISGLISQSEYHEALLVFKKLIADDCLTSANVATMVCTVSACGSLGSVSNTKCLHVLLEKTGMIESEISVANSLIDAYAKCGNLCHAKEVFDDIQETERDLYSWTAMISAFAMHGRGLDSLNVFMQMEHVSRLVPDAVTFLVVLSGCAHSGLVEEGISIFESMRKRYHVEPNLQHYGCLVDLLGRAGMLEQACNIVENMHVDPNLAILGSLLSGCRLHNKMVLGLAVSRKMEKLKEKGGCPILLSNMYANDHEWGKVAHVRKETREVMQAKPPGRSWIVVKDEVHEFFAGKDISQQDMELHVALATLDKIASL